MTNLEAAQATYDEAMKKLEWCAAPTEVRRAVHTLKVMIDEMRMARDNQRKLAETMTW
jgi:hypothetical protein